MKPDYLMVGIVTEDSWFEMTAATGVEYNASIIKHLKT
jgi:hypothetical protein